MNGIMVGVLFVLGIVIIILGGVAVMLSVKPKKEEEDFTFVMNLMPQFADGRAYGIRVDSAEGKNERTHYTYSPRDYKANFKGKFKDVPINIARNRVKSFPKGTWSKDKNIDVLLPPDASRFPKKWLETDVGKALALVTEIQNSVDAEVNMMREGGARKDEILKRLGDGELSQKFLNIMTEIQKDALKQATMGRDNKFGGIPSSGPTKTLF